MKRDKSLNIFLAALFSVSGAVIMLLAWLQPMPESERVLSIIIGGMGLLIAVFKAFSLKVRSLRASEELAVVEVDIKEQN